MKKIIYDRLWNNNWFVTQRCLKCPDNCKKECHQEPVIISIVNGKTVFLVAKSRL